MENRYRTSVSGTRSHTISFQNGTDTRKKIVELKVDGMPTAEETLPSAPGGSPAPVPVSPSPVRILVEIRMSNGLHISQKNLSYHELVKLVEKLEGLC